jgi:GntR family transcriptional regulator
MSRIPVPKSIKEKLELPKEDEKVVQIKRVRFLENKAFAYTSNYLPIEIGSKINEKQLYKKALLRILEQDLGIEFTEAFQTIQASFADQEVSDYLGIASGSPILFAERIMYSQRRKPVELVQSSYRGDIYKYVVRLKHFKRKRGSIWIHQAK